MFETIMFASASSLCTGILGFALCNWLRNREAEWERIHNMKMTLAVREMEDATGITERKFLMGEKVGD
jgi:hypothetical protein